MGRMRRRSSCVALLLAATLALASCTAPDRGPAPETTTPAGTSDVGVQLFQWTWDAIATECTHLGPAGYDWVLTSPPQEHILGEAWWTAYQPVSYLVESRLGTREQFAAMVSACDAAGVGVVADAVINHMTGQDEPGVGWAGSPYEHYEYPGIYSDENGDFHHCGAPGGDIGNYLDAAEVQGCELVNLADLATETEHVRTTIVAYLEDLLSLGVAGFRIDAAKHMPAEDVAAIVERLPQDTVIWQEVIRGAGEPITPEDYLGSGDVFEFGYGRDLPGFLGGTTFRRFVDLGHTGGLVPSEQAVVFVDNHDTERDGSTMSYRDGREYALAGVLMLAGDYGTPVVYSGYAFSDRDAGPEQDADGAVLDAQCADGVGPDSDFADGDWVCTHRWAEIEPMVAWRAAAAGAAVQDVASEGDLLAFGRGERAFVVVNRGDEPTSGTWTTSLSDGTYCDVAVTDADGGCAEVEVVGGELSGQVPALGYLAIHVAG